MESTRITAYNDVQVRMQAARVGGVAFLHKPVDEQDLLGSQQKGMQKNADGSVHVYFRPKVPMGKENNWVQTVPGKSWNTVLRLYSPLEPWLDKMWRPGDIELVQ